MASHRDLPAALPAGSASRPARGDIDGVNMLGRCHEARLGASAINLDKARACYQRRRENHPGLSSIWRRCCCGTRDAPARRCSDISHCWFALRQGNAKAMNMIGRYRELGWSGPVNIPSAIRWYRRARRELLSRRGAFRALPAGAGPYQQISVLVSPVSRLGAGGFLPGPCGISLQVSTRRHLMP